MASRVLDLVAGYFQQVTNLLLETAGLTSDRTFTFPDRSGTLALAHVAYSAKATNYTVVEADLGTVIRFSGGSYTATLSAVASLSTGFSVWLVNNASGGTHVLTIDPNGSETIDGKTTLTLYRGQGVLLYNSGSDWRVLACRGFSRGYSENIDSTSTPPTASGSEAVALGSNATASGDYAHAVGASSTGVGSVASGISSVAHSGGTAAAVSAYAFGDGVLSRSSRGAKGWGNGYVANPGDAQYRMQQARGQTTNATPLVLTADAAAATATNIFRMPNNSTYTFRVMVTGHRTDTTGRASYAFEGCITRDANAASTALASSTKTVVYETTASYDATVTADTTNGGLIITVTGASGHTMTWVAHIEAAEATS